MDLLAVIPAINRWAIVGRPDGTLFADILRKLREAGGLLADVFAQATPRFNNPVNLKRVIAMIDKEDWSAMDVDVKGAVFEGLLERPPAKARKARANSGLLRAGVAVRLRRNGTCAGAYCRQVRLTRCYFSCVR